MLSKAVWYVRDNQTHNPTFLHSGLHYVQKISAKNNNSTKLYDPQKMYKRT
jgi:hypothetical protein